MRADACSCSCASPDSIIEGGSVAYAHGLRLASPLISPDLPRRSVQTKMHSANRLCVLRACVQTPNACTDACSSSPIAAALSVSSIAESGSPTAAEVGAIAAAVTDACQETEASMRMQFIQVLGNVHTVDSACTFGTVAEDP